jgi:hypothetical protein
LRRWQPALAAITPTTFRRHVLNVDTGRQPADRMEEVLRTGRGIRTAVLIGGLLLASAHVPAASAKQRASTTTTVVRGSFINTAEVCSAATPHSGDPTKVDVACDASSTYTGGLDGETRDHLTATVDLATGDITEGAFDEWFYGTYSGEDGSLGGLHYAGSFFIDGKTSSFHATAKILGGTCFFKGSRGTVNFDGMEVYGGFVMKLIRPAPVPASDSTCNPLGDGQ